MIRNFFFKKILRLPSPIETGLADSNALPSKRFSPCTQKFSWEDYYSFLQKNYAIRFAIWKIYDAVKSLIYCFVFLPFSKLNFWLISHLLKKYRYHLLDLRQPRIPLQQNTVNYDHYSYGYLHTGQRMLYAVFNLLKEYEKNEANSIFDQYDGPEWIQKRNELNEEVHFLIDWFKQKRKHIQLEIESLTDDYIQFRKVGDDQAQVVLEKISNLEKKLEEETDQMLIRAVKLRQAFCD